MSRPSTIIALLVVASVLTGIPVGVAGAERQATPYIVVLTDAVGDPAATVGVHSQALGFKPTFVYRHALKGYAASLSRTAVTRLLSNPLVDFIQPDGSVSLSQTQPPQVISSAVLRIDGDESSTASGDGSGSVPVNVAVVDSGVDATHPDLNVVGGFNCRGPRRQEFGVDVDGHGTMVGGFIGALDNDIGRVGVAPGARLWSVRVGGRKSFPWSQAICGIDWVTGTRTDADSTNDIAVANMSFGGPRTGDTGSCIAPTKQDAVHLAVCNALDAGVSIVTSAGNSSSDFQDIAPATYDEVLTATAMADRDGQPGGLGGAFTCDPNEFDDTSANFTNFATLAEDQAHTVAAPGVCISSTFPGGQYGAGSGTSFAAPLVTGTVALCIWSGPCAGLTPQQITEKIVADAAAYNSANPEYGFDGDPLRPAEGKYHGYLVRAGEY